jgi:hypothetical protein
MVNTFVMERLRARCEARWVEEREGTSMANYHSNTNATPYNRHSNQKNEWTQFIAQASYEGGQAFLKTIGNADPSLTDAQLEADELHVEQRYVRSLDYARRDRSNPGPHIMSAVRNWSRKQALAILREKVAGKQIQHDFYQPFQLDLQQEIATMISDLQQDWEQEDEQRDVAERQRIAEKRQKAEQAFGSAYPYIRGLSESVLNGERQRQTIFESGQQAAQQWAQYYGASVKERERQLEERIDRIQAQERENREHQIALRSLAKWDDKRSFADTVVHTGKNTLGCLFLWLLVIVAILLAIYFVFPHH